MERLKRTLLVLALLPLATGCGSVVQVSVVTKTATPAPPAPSPTMASVELTSTHTPPPQPGPPTATPEPPTSTPEPPTSTPEPPTLTPEPPTATPEPGPIRVQFEPGATSATLTGHIERTGEGGVEYGARYVLRALAGQTMEVVITSPNGDVLLSIVGADGVPLKRYVDDRADWRGVLHATQDYFIRPVSVGADTSYVLTVTISPLEPQPTRIQFEPGATSAVVEGYLEPGLPDRYVLRALRGQRMDVRVLLAETVDIVVEGQDGSNWSAVASEGVLRIEVLPATQDYVITLALPVSVSGTVGYAMEVGVY